MSVPNSALNRKCRIIEPVQLVKSGGDVVVVPLRQRWLLTKYFMAQLWLGDSWEFLMWCGYACEGDQRRTPSFELVKRASHESHVVEIIAIGMFLGTEITVGRVLYKTHQT
jgi:hypothetical protein